METTDELKYYLTQGLEPEDIIKDTHSQIDMYSEHLEVPRYKQKYGILVENLESAETLIVELEEQVRDLETKLENISDEDFSHQFERLRNEIDTLTSELTRTDPSVDYDRRYLVDFIGRDEIPNLETFLEARAMLWVPKKEDIDRLLFIAKESHDTRIKRGELLQDDPITIIDVGGANGLLAKLLVDEAKVQGLNIKISVVDPDSKTLIQAKKYYRKDENLFFINEDSAQFVENEWKDDTTISPLIVERESLVDRHNKTLFYFKELGRAVRGKISNNKFDANDLDKLRRILKENFNLDLPDTDYLKGNDWYELECQFRTEQDYPDQEERIGHSLLSQLNSEVQTLTNKIEDELRTRPSSYDIAINSWMPKEIDFTADIRFINAATITYMVENYGDTGIQPDAPFSDQINKVGQEVSYNPGNSYEMDLAWVGPSVPELSYPDPSRSFLNGIIVETKAGYPRHTIPVVKQSSTYPWEKDHPKLKVRSGVSKYDFVERSPMHKVLEMSQEMRQKTLF